MTCSCGRSPTGKYVEWHNLSEPDYLIKKSAWQKNQAVKKQAG